MAKKEPEKRAPKAAASGDPPVKVKRKAASREGDPAPRRPKRERPAPPPPSDDAEDLESTSEAARTEDDGVAEGEELAVAGASALDKPALDPVLDAAREGEEVEDETPTQLGSQRYVMAGFFAAGLVAAFVFGKIVHGVWSWLSNKEWFSSALPSLSSIADEDRTTYGTIVGALLAVFFMVRTYRKPDVRAWTDDVASELSKVKWPTKKDVSNSTMVVIAASTIATLYLALLDRFWAFVTNLVYGTGT
jgi:preprotein translocase subunit SecE